MAILWWLAPPVVATVVAMLWVSWVGRDRRSEVDRERAVRRLGVAISKPAPAPRRPGGGRGPASVTARRTPRPGERSSGVAVRPSSRAGVERPDTRRAS